MNKYLLSSSAESIFLKLFKHFNLDILNILAFVLFEDLLPNKADSYLSYNNIIQKYTHVFSKRN